MVNVSPKKPTKRGPRLGICGDVASGAESVAAKQKRVIRWKSLVCRDFRRQAALRNSFPCATTVPLFAR